VKWGVRPGSFTHTTELFGPVLGVMRAKHLREAVALVNETGYGLTSGLESLDDREQEVWQDSLKAGNLYINRVTTGAVVLRQPFGGMGKSAFGPGIKVGGPNYIVQLMDFSQTGEPKTSASIADPQLEALRNSLLKLLDTDVPHNKEEVAWVVAAIGSYDSNVKQEFGQWHDHFRLVGQDNLRRYVPVPELRIRVHPADSFFQIFARVCAAKAVACRITLSCPPKYRSSTLRALEGFTEPWAGAIEYVEESDEELASVIRERQTDRIRYATPDRVPASILAAVQDTGVYVARSPVLAEGRIELLWYLREQSISFDYHRYGNLGERASEKRADVL
jgi:RHH-type proline utilization regulon transcriptional repressor/proline dehydrogenase/delta 1-pyrroline-5-carboxylate dehydrogenase